MSAPREAQADGLKAEATERHTERKPPKAQKRLTNARKPRTPPITPTNTRKANTERFKGIAGHTERESNAPKSQSTAHNAPKTRHNGRTARKAHKHTDGSTKGDTEHL